MRIMLALLAPLLAGCDRPPCKSPEAAKRAAAAYEQCLGMVQNGDGGSRCGTNAYDTYCVKP